MKRKRNEGFQMALVEFEILTSAQQTFEFEKVIIYSGVKY